MLAPKIVDVVTTSTTICVLDARLYRKERQKRKALKIKWNSRRKSSE
jgi:hypothetical protein